MSEPFTLKICVIWEEEIRLAARLLQKMQEASEEDFPAAAKAALNACLAALYGLKDEHSAVIMSADPKKHKFAKSRKPEPPK